MPSSFRQNLLLFIKKTLKATMVVLQGTAIGLGLNYSWHYFLAVYLGWGDSAPDWYFQVQDIIFLTFFFLGLIGWALFNPRLELYLTRKNFKNDL